MSTIGENPAFVADQSGGIFARAKSYPSRIWWPYRRAFRRRRRASRPETSWQALVPGLEIASAAASIVTTMAMPTDGKGCADRERWIVGIGISPILIMGKRI